MSRIKRFGWGLVWVVMLLGCERTDRIEGRKVIPLGSMVETRSGLKGWICSGPWACSSNGEKFYRYNMDREELDGRYIVTVNDFEIKVVEENK